MGEEETKNDFGNIELLPNKTAQLADWQFKEIVVETINKLILVANQLGATLSDQESEDEAGEDKPDQENMQKEGEAPVEEEVTVTVVKSKYKILQDIEFPKGTSSSLEVGNIIELTDEEANEFADGLIEKVENK